MEFRDSMIMPFVSVEEEQNMEAVIASNIFFVLGEKSGIKGDTKGRLHCLLLQAGILPAGGERS